MKGADHCPSRYFISVATKFSPGKMSVTGGDAKDCESLLINCQARCRVELQLPRKAAGAVL